MANQRLFIEEHVDMARVGNSMSTKYCYTEDGRLTIFWKGQKVAERTGVEPGDAFIVSCNGSEPSISKLKVPHRNEELLMWLLSFNKWNRANSDKEYAELLEEQRIYHDWWDYEEWTTSGDGYAFTCCNRPDCNGVQHIAAYVDRKVDKALVKEILLKCRGIYWPRSFTEKLLRKRFGFTDVDLAELGNKIYW